LDTLQLIDAPSPALLQEVYKLRVRAWRARVPAFPCSVDAWSDAFDSGAQHFVFANAGDPVGAARVTIHDAPTSAPDGLIYADVRAADAPPPIAAFSRLVVCSRYAGAGLSQRLDAVRLAHAAEMGCRSVLVGVSAGEARAAQLRKLGFRELHQARQQVPGILAHTAPPLIFKLDLCS